MRELATILVIVAVGLAGCIGGQAPGNVSEPADDVADTGNASTAVGDASGAASIAHVHDLWKGRQQITLLDRDVQINATRTDASGEGPMTRSVGVNDCYDSSIEFGAWCLGRRVVDVPPSDDPAAPRVVAPGTWAVSVSVSWSDPTITGVDVAAMTANDDTVRMGDIETSGGSERFNATRFGDDREFIPLLATDDGHATDSKWSFELTASGDLGDLGALADGTIHVTAKAHRMDGDLPAEPPHPDWYGETETYFVGYASETANNAYRVTYMGTEWVEVDLTPRNPIPPGTKEVVVAVNITDDSPTADQDQTAPDVELTYEHDAGHDWYVDEVEVEPETVEDGHRIYRIPVTEEMADSLYTCAGRNSTWSLHLSVQPQALVEDEPVLGTDVRGAMHFAGRVEMTAHATKEIGAAPADLEPADPEDVDGCGRVHDRYEGAYYEWDDD